MLSDQKLQTLKMKGLRMFEQYKQINYFVTVKHLVGYLEAQTNIEGKAELEKINHQLVKLAAQIFAELAQNKPKQDS